MGKRRGDDVVRLELKGKPVFLFFGEEVPGTGGRVQHVRSHDGRVSLMLKHHPASLACELRPGHEWYEEWRAARESRGACARYLVRADVWGQPRKKGGCRWYTLMETMDATVLAIPQLRERLDWVAERITEAVRCLGVQGLIYSDLKPPNVMWRARDDAVKLVDLGGAFERGGAGVASFPRPGGHTGGQIAKCKQADAAHALAVTLALLDLRAHGDQARYDWVVRHFGYRSVPGTGELMAEWATAVERELHPETRAGRLLRTPVRTLEHVLERFADPGLPAELDLPPLPPDDLEFEPSPIPPFL